MTPRLSLSPVRAFGDIRIAALEQSSVTAWSGRHGIGGGGAKTPLAILIGAPAGLRIYAASGARLTPEEVDALLPGTVSRFLNEAAGDTIFT